MSRSFPPPRSRPRSHTAKALEIVRLTSGRKASLVGWPDTPGAGISAPMAALRAPRAIQRGKVGSPLGGVALAGQALERSDLTA